MAADGNTAATGAPPARPGGAEAPEIVLPSWATFGVPGRDDIARLEAVMLWPDDAAARDRFLAAANAEMVEGVLRQAAAGAGETAVDAAALIEVMSHLRRAPRLDDMKEDARRRTGHGTAAAMILAEYLYGGESKIETIKAGVASRLGAKLDGFSVSTIQNTVWKRFRSVAHLWLASCVIMETVPAVERVPVCRVDQLSDLLVLAARIRADGVSKKLLQNSAVLDDRTAWRVPTRFAGTAAPSVSNAT